MTKEKLIKIIASTLVAQGCNETTQANWCFDFEEIEDMFDFQEGRIEELIKDIDNEVTSCYAGVAETDIDYNEKTYSLTFYTDYCGCNYLIEEEEERK